MPDSAYATQKELDTMPPYVRYYKCNGNIEESDPCHDEKYTSYPCRHRYHKAKWHPGLKVYICLLF